MTSGTTLSIPKFYNYFQTHMWIFYYSFSLFNTTVTIPGFFSWGDCGSPRVAKILPVPPNWPPSPLFDQSLSPWPQLSFVPENFTSFFSPFSLLFSCTRKTVSESSVLKIMPKNTKICSNFAVGGILGLSGLFFPSPTSSDSILDISPSPFESVPDKDRKLSPKQVPPPPPEICEKTLHTVHFSHDFWNRHGLLKALVYSICHKHRGPRFKFHLAEHILPRCFIRMSLFICVVCCISNVICSNRGGGGVQVQVE